MDPIHAITGRAAQHRPVPGLVCARYLYTFKPGEYTLMFGNAAADGSVPIHMRESGGALSYDTAEKVPAFGLPFFRSMCISTSRSNPCRRFCRSVREMGGRPMLRTSPTRSANPIRTPSPVMRGKVTGAADQRIQTRGVAWATPEVAQTALWRPTARGRRRILRPS